MCLERRAQIDGANNEHFPRRHHKGGDRAAEAFKYRVRESSLFGN